MRYLLSLRILLFSFIKLKYKIECLIMKITTIMIG